MAWIAVGTMAATTALSVNQEKQKAKQMKRHNEGQAEMTRYSPWTGQTGKIESNVYDPVSAGFGGALQGLGMAQQLGKIGGAPKPTTPPPYTPPASPTSNSLGGSDMASQFGQMGQSPSMYSSMKQNNPFASNSFASSGMGKKIY